MAKNKVKYNLKNVHYAKILTASGFDEDVTYGTPKHIPGAVSISIDPVGDTSSFYADGYAYFQVASNQGYEGDLEIAMIPDEFRKDILGDIEDTAKVLVENADAKATPFALLFEFDGDQKQIRHVLYNCIATRPNISSATKEEAIEVQTETLNLSASPLANGNVKAKTTDETTETAYNNWFKSVHVPTTV